MHLAHTTRILGPWDYRTPKTSFLNRLILSVIGATHKHRLHTFKGPSHLSQLSSADLIPSKLVVAAQGGD